MSARSFAIGGASPVEMAVAVLRRLTGRARSRPTPLVAALLAEKMAFFHCAVISVFLSASVLGGSVFFEQANDRVLPPSPEPFQHTLQASLTPTVPLTLGTVTVGGNQTINLAGLRVRALTARSDSGRLKLTLPARPGGPYALVTRSGRVEVTAPEGATPEALRVNSQSGDLTLQLGGAAVDALNAGTQSGDVTLTLPRQVNRGTVTTGSGDVDVTVQAGTRGNLDIRTGSGDVTLHVPPGLRVRVRFTDRETLLLPPGTPTASSPQLDVFVDTTSGEFDLQD